MVAIDYSVDLPVTRARERIVIDDFGVDPASPGLDDDVAVQAAFLDAIRAKNRSAWVCADIWIDHSAMLLDILDPTAISLKTLENYASVARAFPKAWRKVPLSMSHYQAAAKLVNTKPTEALALLRSAYDGGMDRAWVRSEAKRILGEVDTEIEVTLTWDAEHQVFYPSQSLTLPKDYTRTIRLRQVAQAA